MKMKFKKIISPLLPPSLMLVLVLRCPLSWQFSRNLFWDRCRWSFTHSSCHTLSLCVVVVPILSSNDVVVDDDDVDDYNKFNCVDCVFICFPRRKFNEFWAHANRVCQAIDASSILICVHCVSESLFVFLELRMNECDFGFDNNWNNVPRENMKIRGRRERERERKNSKFLWKQTCVLVCVCVSQCRNKFRWR